jgi:3-phosphoshikimate 1-carboxyvinyltransferase
MLRGFGYDVRSSNNRISLSGGGSLKGCDIEVPSDISSAAFFMVAGCISKDSSITLNSVNINPTRTGVIDILKLMGGNIELLNQRLQAGELIADIKVTSSKLKGIQIPANLVPLAIDEFPVLFIAASCAEDGIRILGGKFTKQASSIKSHHDHRISMAFAIASVRSKFDIQIEGVDNVKTSFPNFVELANSIGMSIKQEG